MNRYPVVKKYKSKIFKYYSLAAKEDLEKYVREKAAYKYFNSIDCSFVPKMIDYKDSKRLLVIKYIEEIL